MAADGLVHKPGEWIRRLRGAMMIREAPPPPPGIALHNIHSKLELFGETQMPSDSLTTATSPFPRHPLDLEKAQQKVDFGISSSPANNRDTLAGKG